MASTYKRNLIIGFGASLLILLASSIASYYSIRNLLGSAALVDQTNDVIYQLEQIPALLTQAESSQRGFLLSGEDEYLSLYADVPTLLNQTLNKLSVHFTENPEQKGNLENLEKTVSQRISILTHLINQGKEGAQVNLDELRRGRSFMTDVRLQVERMKEIELKLLEDRTLTMNRFAAFTPILIIVAALIALLITGVFFLKVNADFALRIKLQNELEEKDVAIRRRINLIQEVADKISSGNYSVRVEDEEEDELGNLAVYLNKMAASLEHSFNLVSDNEWLQSGIARLNNNMIGHEEPHTLIAQMIEFLARYTDSNCGAVYLLEDNDTMQFAGGYAFQPGRQRKHIRLGEGISGQAALSNEELLLSDLDENSITISYASGEVKPRHVLAIPIRHERELKGVIELATTKEFSDRDIAFLKRASADIGVAISTVQGRKRLQELLEETQSQSEELMMQHSEMESLNTELEAQALRLQASEEELKIQQEELQQINEELEERSRLLEERNQMITEQNHDIQAKSKQLELTTRYKSEFLANMSHELRTPLNSILLLSRLISENNDQNLTPEQIEYAKVIQNSGVGLLSLIDEILDLSKIESGKMDLEYTQVNIGELTQDLRSLFQPLADDKGIALRVEIAENDPGVIETDRMRLEQVLRNLISNAIKFTSSGYVELKIFRSKEDNNKIGFTVKDTGIGIPQEKQKLIFEAFQQADGSTRRKFGGTGLGLSISRELVRLLGGEINLKSAVNEGSEFSVYLPLVKHLSLPDSDTDLVPVSEEEKSDGLSIESGTNNDKYISRVIPESVPDDRNSIEKEDKIILIIEDDTNFALSLLEFTRKKGYKGIIAVRGDDGVALARKYKPVGILLDLQLPVKSGWEVMDELKQDRHTRHIPVHIMSSHEVKRESILKGAIDFVNKPVAYERISEIFKRIEEVLAEAPGKVLIVEENAKHARALAFFLENFDIHTEIKDTISDSITALKKSDVNCVILDMGVPGQRAYEMLEEVKKADGLEHVPIIIFTGRSLSTSEEVRIRKYADSIVVKTAHSYRRILDEVTLFLHLVEENNGNGNGKEVKRLGTLNEVLRDKTVLIADDDVRNIYSLSKALEQFGIKTISAVDGKEALEELKNNPRIDIVLMDMMMPEMDGYEAIARIRENPEWKHLPVLAVTAKAMTGDREKCINAGASDYITKPVDIDQLLSLLRVWLYEKTIRN